jgi:DNA repair exonuclease SbcCD ATPase subunit
VSLLALALALEMAAIVQEKRHPRLETVLLDAVPRALDESGLDRVLAALSEQPRERPLVIAADDAARAMLATRLGRPGMAS